MADPTLVAPTAPRCAPKAATLAAAKVVRACQKLAQARLGDLGEVRETWRSIEEPLGLLLDGWKDLSLPMLKTKEAKLASGAVMVAGDFHNFPEIHIPYISHFAVRKEGV
jgi:hypothetical protein